MHDRSPRDRSWAGFCLGLLAAGISLAAGGQTLGAEQEWRGLVVAPENRCAPYRSNDYPYPQSVELQLIAEMGGKVYGPYTGRYFSSRRKTDIEHIVARSEAHDSGLCRAKIPSQREILPATS